MTTSDDESLHVLHDFIAALSQESVSLNIALLGNRKNNEIDVAVIQDLNSLEAFNGIMAFQQIHRFRNTLRFLNSYNVFHTDHHRHIANSGNTYIHMVYYPSPFFMEKWEVSSFASYVYEYGNFVVGDRSCIKHLALRYDDLSDVLIEIKTNPLREDVRKHLYGYLNIAVTYYLYSSSNLVPIDEVMAKLAYCSRYVLSQFERLNPSLDVSSSYEELFKNKFELDECNKLNKMVEMFRKKERIVDLELIDTMFYEICVTSTSLIRKMK